MRALLAVFGLLLLANLIYFVWQPGQPDTPDAPPPIPPGVERLQLLKEREGVDGNAAAGALAGETGAVANAPIPSPNRMCKSLGIFKDAAAAEKLPERLRSLALPPARQRMEYRVYLPSLASRETALEVSRRLAGLGVEDYFIVNDADRRNAISLGVYRQQAGARHRLEQIIRLGFAPEAEVCYLEAEN